MKLLKTLLATAIVTSTIPAMAYEAGDIVVKAGIINVNPKSDSGIDGVTVKDDTQLGLTVTYMATPKIGVEVLAATPFKHTVEAGGERIATVKHLPPTISALYFPLSGESKLQPYLGLGVNHTFFFDEDGAVAHLGKSTGLAMTLGVNYDLGDNMLASVAAWKVDIDAELNDSGTDVEIDPIAIMVSCGYKF